MSIFEQINSQIKVAMKARDSVRLDTLRMLKSKILTVDARGNLSDVEIFKLFKTYHGNLQEALEHARTAQRDDLIQKLQNEMSIVEEFLPKAPSSEETHKIIENAIAESGAKTKKDLGLVMKNVMKQYPTIDGKIVKDLASQMLP